METRDVSLETLWEVLRDGRLFVASSGSSPEDLVGLVSTTFLPNVHSRVESRMGSLAHILDGPRVSLHVRHDFGPDHEAREAFSIILKVKLEEQSEKEDHLAA